MDALNDGWLDPKETWAYASATTITVPAGAASRYSVGDKIKLTQTTVKYFYVTAVADTVLTVTGGTDYTVANAAISANYYSKMASPVGFPQWFTTAAPVFDVNTLDDGSAGQPTTAQCRFTINGRTLIGYYRGSGVKAGLHPYFTITTFPFIAPAGATTTRRILGDVYINASTDYLGSITLDSTYYGIVQADMADNLVLTSVTFKVNYEI
jgi:hypothetical protein